MERPGATLNMSNKTGEYRRDKCDDNLISNNREECS